MGVAAVETSTRRDLRPKRAFGFHSFRSLQPFDTGQAARLRLPNCLLERRRGRHNRTFPASPNFDTKQHDGCDGRPYFEWSPSSHEATPQSSAPDPQGLGLGFMISNFHRRPRRAKVSMASQLPGFRYVDAGFLIAVAAGSSRFQKSP